MKKPYFGIALSLLFVLLGIYLITKHPLEESTREFYAGIACIVFFGIAALMGIIGLFRHKA